MALTYQMFSWSTGVTPSLKHISASQILITYNNELDFEAKDAEFWEMAEKQQELQWRWSKKLSGLQVSGVRWIIQNTIRPSSALDWHSWPSNLPITDDRHYHSLGWRLSVMSGGLKLRQDLTMVIFQLRIPTLITIWGNIITLYVISWFNWRISVPVVKTNSV